MAALRTAVVVNPTSNLDPGRGPGQVLGLGASLLLRRVPHRRSVETFTASTVDIRAHGHPPREIDGDVMPAGDRLRVEVVPAALWACVP